jgi:hypothetical protein
MSNKRSNGGAFGKSKKRALWEIRQVEDRVRFWKGAARLSTFLTGQDERQQTRVNKYQSRLEQLRPST